MNFLFIIITTLLLASCSTPPSPAPITSNQNQQEPIDQGVTTLNPAMDMASNTAHYKLKLAPKELLSHIKSSIITSYKDWVVFDNGTYIIFDNIDTIFDVQQTAIRWLKEHQAKNEQEKNWDYNITDLDLANGWSVFGNGYGIYTFVHVDELSPQASPSEIGTYAKAKRTLDEKNPQIIYISSSKGIQEIVKTKS